MTKQDHPEQHRQRAGDETLLQIDEAEPALEALRHRHQALGSREGPGGYREQHRLIAHDDEQAREQQ